MYKVSIEPHWRIARGKKPSMDTAMLLRLLGAIQSEGAILQAARNLGLSYRHAWGLLREAESLFGAPLLEKHRGVVQHLPILQQLYCGLNGGLLPVCPRHWKAFLPNLKPNSPKVYLETTDPCVCAPAMASPYLL